MSLKAEAPVRVLPKRTTLEWAGPVVASVVLVVATTLVIRQIDLRLNQDHLIFIYFVPTTMIAIRYGSVPAMGVVLASGLCAAYFLYPPDASFAVSSGLDMMELALFSLLALLASQVVSGFAKDRDVKVRRRPTGQSSR